MDARSFLLMTTAVRTVPSGRQPGIARRQVPAAACCFDRSPSFRSRKRISLLMRLFVQVLECRLPKRLQPWAIASFERACAN